MALYAHNTNISHGLDYFNLLDPFKFELGGFNGLLRGGSSQSPVLDNEKRPELVKAPVKAGSKRVVSEEKALAALKSHSEAERRRRERINSHLTTLRGLVPCTEKMDKATLLAEVINQVKELKKNATEASKGLLIPTDNDEVKVDSCANKSGQGSLLFTASICCNFRPELLSDLRQAVDSLQLKIIKTEISTLEDRLKCTFMFTTHTENSPSSDAELQQQQQRVASLVYEALNSVLQKGLESADYSLGNIAPCKRRRVSSFESLGSSS